jgi:hypothetical protein
MENELFRCIKMIDNDKLTQEDKEELLRMFMVTQNDQVRNQLAFIFSDLKFDKAVPYILKKINDKSLSHNNGSLVYSLEPFDLRKYFIQLIKVICEHEYEPRLLAYGFVEDLSPTISKAILKKALAILEDCRISLEGDAAESGENSRLHFIEQTKKMLLKHLTLTPS